MESEPIKGKIAMSPKSQTTITPTLPPSLMGSLPTQPGDPIGSGRNKDYEDYEMVPQVTPQQSDELSTTEAPEKDPKVKNLGAECWDSCGGKEGSCPDFCGENGFCCRKDWKYKECDGTLGVGDKHTCVAVAQPEPEVPKSTTAIFDEDLHDPNRNKAHRNLMLFNPNRSLMESEPIKGKIAMSPKSQTAITPNLPPSQMGSLPTQPGDPIAAGVSDVPKMTDSDNTDVLITRKPITEGSQPPISRKPIKEWSLPPISRKPVTEGSLPTISKKPTTELTIPKCPNGHCDPISVTTHPEKSPPNDGKESAGAKSTNGTKASVVELLHSFRAAPGSHSRFPLHGHGLPMDLPMPQITDAILPGQGLPEGLLEELFPQERKNVTANNHEDDDDDDDYDYHHYYFTEPPPDLQRHNGADCWYSCGEKDGPCEGFCGRDGWCCRKEWPWGGCDGKIGGDHHQCVLDPYFGEYVKHRTKHGGKGGKGGKGKGKFSRSAGLNANKEKEANGDEKKHLPHHKAAKIYDLVQDIKDVFHSEKRQ